MSVVLCNHDITSVGEKWNTGTRGAEPFPRTGVSTKDVSVLIIVLLFYVVIMCCNECRWEFCNENSILMSCPSREEVGVLEWSVVQRCGCRCWREWFHYSLLDQFSSGSEVSQPLKDFCRCSLASVKAYATKHACVHSFIQLTFSPTYYKDFIALTRRWGL